MKSPLFQKTDNAFARMGQHILIFNSSADALFITHAMFQEKRACVCKYWSIRIAEIWSKLESFNSSANAYLRKLANSYTVYIPVHLKGYDVSIKCVNQVYIIIRYALALRIDRYD